MQPFRGYQLESIAFKLYSLQAEQLGLKSSLINCHLLGFIHLLHGVS